MYNWKCKKCWFFYPNVENCPIFQIVFVRKRVIEKSKCQNPGDGDVKNIQEFLSEENCHCTPTKVFARRTENPFLLAKLRILFCSFCYYWWNLSEKKKSNSNYKIWTFKKEPNGKQEIKKKRLTNEKCCSSVFSSQSTRKSRNKSFTIAVPVNCLDTITSWALFEEVNPQWTDWLLHHAMQ